MIARIGKPGTSNPGNPSESVESVFAGVPVCRSVARCVCHIIVATTLALGTVSMFGCDGLFFHPTRRVYASPDEHRLRYERVSIPTHDGLKLDGWFFPAADGPARGTVVHFHGNAGNITGHFEHVAWLPATGWNVLCFDYRGYGRSQGRPTRKGLVLDGHAAIEYVKTRGDVDPARIIVLGQSLGGAVGIVVAAERKDIAGLAVDGAFSHYRRIAAWHIRRNPLLFMLAWWVPALILPGQDPIDHVARVAPTPLFIMHGRADEVVDPRMAEELYAAAGEPKELWLIDGVGHYTALDELANVARPKLLQFFNRCVDGTGKTG